MNWLQRLHMSLVDTPWFPLWLIFIVFTLVLLRYIFIAGPAYLVFWKWLRQRMHHRRIQQTFPKPKFVRNEFLWSLSTFVIFGITGCLIFALKRRGLTVVSVAHRLDAALRSDQVLVMRHGAVVEHGPPQELLARDGAFRALVQNEQQGTVSA